MDDPIRNLDKFADPTLPPMTNEQIDELLYGWSSESWRKG